MSKFKEFIEKAKRAPKKDLAMGIGCFAGAIALIVWAVFLFFI